MIITCPECASEFDIPFAMIGPTGRKVRCANCRHEWHAEMPKPAQVVENPYKKSATPVSATGFEIEFDIFKNTQDAPSFAPDGVNSKKPKKARKTGKMTFINGNTRSLAVAFVVLLVLGGVFVSLRPVLSGISPAMAHLYSGFGMDVPVLGQGLGLERLAVKQIWTDKGNTLEIGTKIINLSESSLVVPAVQVQAMNEDGQPTGEKWRFDAPVKELEAQETVPFTVKLPEMPKSTGEVLSLKATFIR